jgi:acetylornithine deacetylase/succinyl-diaminopimelate desuccinylase-like protein
MEKVLPYIESNKERYLAELKEFLAIPSVSSQKEHDGDTRKCAEWVSEQMKKIGMENVQILPTGGHPVVFSEWLHAAEKPTVLFYGHYDVQPVDPLNLWTSPPFEATVRG